MSSHPMAWNVHMYIGFECVFRRPHFIILDWEWTLNTFLWSVFAVWKNFFLTMFYLLKDLSSNNISLWRKSFDIIMCNINRMRFEIRLKTRNRFYSARLPVWTYFSLISLILIWSCNRIPFRWPNNNELGKNEVKLFTK